MIVTQNCIKFVDSLIVEGVLISLVTVCLKQTNYIYKKIKQTAK